MQLLQQSEATAAQRRLFFHAVDATDGISAETGLTGTGFLSKDGATPVATTASLSELNATNMPGRYYIEFTAGELDTLGVIEFRFKAAACAEIVARAQVIPYDPYDAVRMGLTALPNAAAEAAGGLYTRGTGAGQINQPTNGRVDTNVVAMAAASIASGVIAAAELQNIEDEIWDALKSAHVVANSFGDFLDIEVSGRLASADINLTGGAVDVVTAVTNAVTVGTINANVIDAASIAASAMDNKGNWNIGKTGYSLTQTFPANFADLSIVVTSGLVDITQTAADKVWATAARILTASTNFNDIAATDIVSAGAITTLTGAVVNVDTVDSVTGAVGSVTGAVGSVAGNVDGNVTGSVGSIATGGIVAASFAAGAIDAAAIATDAIDADALATSAVDEIREAILPKQNEAFTFTFLFVAASDHVTPVTVATGITDFRSIDGAAFAAGGATVTEVGNGIYEYAATAADMNGGVITFRFAATGGTPGAPDDAFVEIVTSGGV